MPINIGFAKIGKSELAWKHFQKIYKPYLRPPFNMLSEQADTTRIPCYLTFADATLQALFMVLEGLKNWSIRITEGLKYTEKVKISTNKIEFEASLNHLYQIIN